MFTQSLIPQTLIFFWHMYKECVHWHTFNIISRSILNYTYNYHYTFSNINYMCDNTTYHNCTCLKMCVCIISYVSILFFSFHFSNLIFKPSNYFYQPNHPLHNASQPFKTTQKQSSKYVF